MKRVWTKEMTEKLIELYPTTNDRELVEIFGLNRSRIKDKANRLKIKKLVRKKNWTEEQVEDLKKYLSKLFTEHMTLNNYGEWELDHIKPVPFSSTPIIS